MDNDFIPKKLKELRKAHNFTQDYVASSIGTVRQTYSSYETGARIPNAQIIYKLAALYNISVDDLLSLTLNVNRDEFFEAPEKTTTSNIISEYLDFLNDPINRDKYYNLSADEKELLYKFSLLSDEDKYEISELINIKLKRVYKSSK